MEVYLLTASRLANLLQILGALVADYIDNPKKPMSKDLQPYVKSALQWKDLPSLKETVLTAVRGGDKLSALYNLGQELKAVTPTFRKNREFTTPELSMLNAIRTYLVSDSETALAYIKKNASLFDAPELARIFTPPIPVSDHKGLRKAVKALVGRDGTHLSAPEAAMIKETNPEAFEKYKELRKGHNLQFKAVLTDYVRASGKSRVPFKDFYKYAIDQGFTHSLVPGFEGFLDDQGRWYTRDNELIQNAPNLSTYTHVTMNDGKDPEARWAFKAFKPDGGYAYGYTANFRRDQSSAKYAHVAELKQHLPAIRNNWLAALKKFDPADKNSVSAVVIEILFSFAARVGSDPGRGVGTLLVKNSTETQQGINLAYVGKDSIPTKHIIKKSTSPQAAQVVAALHHLRAGKMPSAPLFTVTINGRIAKVTPSDINKAFHHFGASSNVSVHKLRTVRGSTLFKELMDRDAEKRPPSTEKEAMDRYKDMTEEVGKLLNHKRGVGTENETTTGSTAALSYIDGDLQIDLWDRWGFRPPVALEKLLKGGDN